jgi:hypothetical protein
MRTVAKIMLGSMMAVIGLAPIGVFAFVVFSEWTRDPCLRREAPMPFSVRLRMGERQLEAIDARYRAQHGCFEDVAAEEMPREPNRPVGPRVASSEACCWFFLVWVARNMPSRAVVGPFQDVAECEVQRGFYPMIEMAAGRFTNDTTPCYYQEAGL